MANQGPFHATIDAFDSGFVLRRMAEVLNGNPSDDAACSGCRAFEWLMRYDQCKRLPSLRPQDVHDVLIPVWLHKEGAAKDAAGKALRVPLSNVPWMAAANDYFAERGSLSKLAQVCAPPPYPVPQPQPQPERGSLSKPHRVGSG